jgi:glutamine synthetase
MKPEEVVQQARSAEVRLVRFLYCDNGGVIRGKTTMMMSGPRMQV